MQCRHLLCCLMEQSGVDRSTGVLLLYKKALLRLTPELVIQEVILFVVSNEVEGTSQLQKDGTHQENDKLQGGGKK